MIKKYNQYLKEELVFRNPFKKKVKNYSEIDPNDVDPYGEEDWDDDLTPILKIAKKQGIPYDQILRLDCSSKDLKNLEGIEKLVNLRYLNCANNNLTNIDNVRGLFNLKHVICFDNSFSEQYEESLQNYHNKRGIKISCYPTFQSYKEYIIEIYFDSIQW